MPAPPRCRPRAEFEKAVESKQVAQQDAERARFIVEKALQDKQSIIIRAQGEARAAELIGRSANPGFIQLRRIDAARSIAQSIAGSQNTVYLPAESLLLSSECAAAPGRPPAPASTAPPRPPRLQWQTRSTAPMARPTAPRRAAQTARAAAAATLRTQAQPPQARAAGGPVRARRRNSSGTAPLANPTFTSRNPRSEESLV